MLETRKPLSTNALGKGPALFVRGVGGGWDRGKGRAERRWKWRRSHALGDSASSVGQAKWSSFARENFSGGSGFTCSDRYRSRASWLLPFQRWRSQVAGRCFASSAPIRPRGKGHRAIGGRLIRTREGKEEH